MEQASNSYVIDAESGAEMARLIDQDRLVTACMGGLCPEVPALAKVRRTLDAACGPGGWAQEMAYTYPDMQVVGIDLSQRMIGYAQALSQVQGLDNVEFRVMDLLQPLDFPDASFDLVNVRFLFGVLRADSWIPLMKELMRVLRPGGVLRWTECDSTCATNAPALERYIDVMVRAFFLDGRSLDASPHHLGITPRLGRFLQEGGCHNVQEKAHVLNWSAGMQAYPSMYKDIRISFKLLQPFLVRMKVAKEQEVEQLYRQTLAQCLSDDFRALWPFLSVWGQKPEGT